MVTLGLSAEKKAEDARQFFSVAHGIEEIVGCKWALQILAQIRRGVCRPGALERALPGLTTKVMNERLVKMTRFGILERIGYPEIPPRVEYCLTPFGERFIEVLDGIERLQREVDSRQD